MKTAGRLLDLALWLAVLAALALLLFSWRAAHAAQPLCGSYAKIVAELDRRYGETPSSVATTNDDLSIEIYRSHRADGKPETWSIVKRVPGTDKGCLVEAGQGDWEDAKSSEAPPTGAAPKVSPPIDPNAGTAL
jgi:hypothetical protein